MKIEIKGTTFIINELFMKEKLLIEIIVEQLKKGQNYAKSSL